MASTGWWTEGSTPAVPVMVAAGVLLSLAAFLLVRQASWDAEHALAERQAAQLHDTLKEYIDRHVLLLRALSGPLAGTAPVTRSGFAMLAEPLLPLYPALRAVAWARRIPASEAPSLESAMRAEGQPGFRLRLGTGPAALAAQYLHVNLLVEPSGAAEGLIGLDITSSPDRAALLSRACRSGDIVATDAASALADASAPGAATAFLPVYARDTQGAGGEARCNALTGYVWATFQLDQLLNAAAGQVGLSVGDAYLIGGWTASATRVLAARPGALERSEPFAPLPMERLAETPAIAHGIGFGGRSWRLLVVPQPPSLFGPQNRSAWMILGCGLLLTGGLVGYVRREACAKRLLQREARARAAMARALRESEERFRLALRHSRVALFSQDRDLRYLWIYSPQAARMPEDLIGHSHADLYDAEDAALLDAIKRPVLETGIGVRQEVPLTVGGQRKVFDLSVEPMHDDSGAVSGLFSAAIDVTEAWEIRQALADAHGEAEHANQAKSRFLAAASHDLRQPFQAMSLFHHILVSKLTDPQHLEIAGKLGEALTAGNALLSALLDTSALEAGNVQPRVIEFDVHEVLSRLVTEIAEQALERGLTLRAVPSSARVCSDPILLERMLRNLLVNALRYTERGSILMGCRRRGDRLAIEVWDTGPGIPADQMSAIFEDFYRCGTDRRDSTGGLGLGLSIVRRTAQILDHPVTVQSRVGRGTVFSISVPLVLRAESMV
ncbi:ATP-binding protein [Azospirillum doebereinerae]|uniref:sensor histidine kinase n=1 Tax=Azospirillum doebereinerae TaxID=92933 RepID=UPI001EE50AFD|nr:CHASE domain-containing protein [Azospirillum doebereinerae]MCG5239998.1 CHASE domain-containing protein [Azospirillum doebereinerae]